MMHLQLRMQSLTNLEPLRMVMSPHPMSMWLRRRQLRRCWRPCPSSRILPSQLGAWVAPSILWLLLKEFTSAFTFYLGTFIFIANELCMLPCVNRVNLRNTVCNTRLRWVWHSFLFHQCFWCRGPDGPTREAPNRPAAGRRMVGREIPDDHEDSDDTESLTALYASPPPTRKASLTISESMSHRWGENFEVKHNKIILWNNQLKLSTWWWNLSIQ